MKRMVTCMFVVLLLAGTATASPFISEDFEGVSSIVSQYTDGGSDCWGAATYCITTNPVNVHSMWGSFGDHTSGSGNMLVINGNAESSAGYFWEGQPSADLAIGGQYGLRFWAASTFPVDPAQIRVSVDGSTVGTMQLPADAGAWEAYTVWFTAESVRPVVRLFDDSFIFNGNDFAIDDISLSGVPEPGTVSLVAAGVALMLLRLRKKR